MQDVQQTNLRDEEYVPDNESLNQLALSSRADLLVIL